MTAVNFTRKLLVHVAQIYAPDGIEFIDDGHDDEVLSCVVCEQELEAWQVCAHVESVAHSRAVEARSGLDTAGTAVEINGVPLLLDNSCIFPRTMFGAGRQLYDDTLGCIVMPDVTGAVDLYSGHHYTVVEFDVPHSAETLPPLTTKVPKHVKYFSDVTSRKRIPALITSSSVTSPGSTESARRERRLRRLATKSGVSARELFGIPKKKPGRKRKQRDDRPPVDE